MIRLRRQRRDLPADLMPDPKRARRRAWEEARRRSAGAGGLLGRVRARRRPRLKFWISLAAILALIFAYRYYMRYAGGSSEAALVILGMLLAFLALMALALAVAIVIARVSARRRSRLTAALLDQARAQAPEAGASSDGPHPTAGRARRDDQPN